MEENTQKHTGNQQVQHKFMISLNLLRTFVTFEEVVCWTRSVRQVIPRNPKSYLHPRRRDFPKVEENTETHGTTSSSLAAGIGDGDEF